MPSSAYNFGVLVIDDVNVAADSTDAVAVVVFPRFALRLTKRLDDKDRRRDAGTKAPSKHNHASRALAWFITPRYPCSEPWLAFSTICQWVEATPTLLATGVGHPQSQAASRRCFALGSLF